MSVNIESFANFTPALATVEPENYGPWNPGVQSTLPTEFMPLATVFSSVNVSSSISELQELSGFCGLPIERLSTFRPERLALHEVLVRVMADLSVPDGEKYEDFGVNFRQMTATIMDKHVAPKLPEIKRMFEDLKREASNFIDMAQTAGSLCGDAADEISKSGASWWSRFVPVRSKAKVLPTARSATDQDRIAIANWRATARSARIPFEQACYQALVATSEAIFSQHGYLTNNRTLITSIALRLVCNDYGSAVIGEFLEPLVHLAARQENYRLLPAQSQPTVMNVKGASASGKSSMRPLQKQLAQRLGVAWSDFALISPDVWRKYLLDYAALGAARRYAGTLTGCEVAIVDQKLDRHMSYKSKVGQLPHLLIDRFRFDSFAQEPEEEEGSRLLTRFGVEVFMFFMITPPEATVERAWKRGEQIGRYKAVDDLLAHNVEAYSGIPNLFFTWALREDKRVHFEFLDNSVTEGQRPRTIAFGLNGHMNILDLNCLLDVDRYQNINIEARTAADIYAKPSSRKARMHGEFLRQCVRRIPIINFADHETGKIYAQMVKGRLTSWSRRVFELAIRDDNARAAFEAIAMHAAPRRVIRCPQGRQQPGSAPECYTRPMGRSLCLLIEHLRFRRRPFLLAFLVRLPGLVSNSGGSSPTMNSFPTGKGFRVDFRWELTREGSVFSTEI
ncbi:MAG TPA: hypothetical protein VNH19_02410 [Candidatus Limnocylindrales bacterium]|nr:hypothetical protein [Candidatus Limnocylindrales bacterium]